MKIKDYKGSNELDTSNILSVAKAFYQGVTYDRAFYPAGKAFQPGQRLCNLETGMYDEVKTFEKITEWDLWLKKNEDWYMKITCPEGCKYRDVRYLPETYCGSVRYSDYQTHWVPTVCTCNKEGQVFVYDKKDEEWYELKMEQDAYDLPCDICEWSTAYIDGAFCRFVWSLFLNFRF